MYKAPVVDSRPIEKGYSAIEKVQNFPIVEVTKFI